MPFSQSARKTELEAMPPSTKVILEELSKGDPMTASELQELTGYAIRTIRYCLKDLHENGFIEKKINLLNMQTMRYQVSSMISAQGQRETTQTKINTEKMKSSLSGSKII